MTRLKRLQRFKGHLHAASSAIVGVSLFRVLGEHLVHLMDWIDNWRNLSELIASAEHFRTNILFALIVFGAAGATVICWHFADKAQKDDERKKDAALDEVMGTLHTEHAATDETK